MSEQIGFQRYVDRRKNPEKDPGTDTRFGAYAFSGDLRVLRRLDRLTPVRIVAQSTVRFWKSFQKNELLGSAVKVSSRQFPQIHDMVLECSKRLDITAPTVYIRTSPHLNAGTYGTNEEAFIIVNTATVEHLTDEELMYVIGHECGHIHNNHVVYRTAAHFLTQGAGIYVSWAVIPATIAINSWSRRGEITCDRAGAVCARDADASIRAMLKLAVGNRKLFEDLDLDEYLTQLDGIQEGWGRFQELMRTHPYLPKRVKALQLFFESSFYKNLIGERGGRALDEIDREVEKVIQVV